MEEDKTRTIGFERGTSRPVTDPFFFVRLEDDPNRKERISCTKAPCMRLSMRGLVVQMDPTPSSNLGARVSLSVPLRSETKSTVGVGVEYKKKIKLQKKKITEPSERGMNPKP